MKNCFIFTLAYLRLYWWEHVFLHLHSTGACKPFFSIPMLLR